MGTNIGQIIERGSFVGPEGREGIFCKAPVGFTGAIVQRVITTALDPTIELETDFRGLLDAISKDNESTTLVGEPCWHNSHGDEGSGHFQYAWDNPHGQRLQVGMLIPQQEVDDPTISGLVEDYNNVATSTELPEDCFPNAVTTCKSTFKLGGEYDLGKVCEGNFSGTSWSCGSETGSTSSQSNETKQESKTPAKTPPSGGSGTSQQKTADQTAKPSNKKVTAKAPKAQKGAEKQRASPSGSSRQR